MISVDTFMGIPVIEDPAVPYPIVVGVPVEPTDYCNPVLYVPNMKKFEDEIWIEQTIATVVRREMKETLEWLYGDPKHYLPYSSRYSAMILRIQQERAKILETDEFRRVQERLEHSARTIASALAQEVGRTIRPPVYGFMETPLAVDPSIIISSL